MKLKRRVADKLFSSFPMLSSLAAAVYGYAIRPKRYFASYGEDVVSGNLLAYRNHGSYVDIGAFHSRWASNTYHLAKRGWRGVVVDVDPAKLLSFKLRKACTARVGAVVPDGFSGDTVQVFKFKRLSSEWDTTSREEALRTRERYGVGFVVDQVPTIPIGQLFRECCAIFRTEKIDYVNIDVEGADESLLVDFDLTLFGVDVIQFENNHLFRGSQRIQNHLTNLGFTHFATMAGTHTYVSQGLLRERFPAESC